jgi:hypothetical protein
MSNPPVRWLKVWFFLRSDADTLLPMFIGSCPIPQLQWGYRAAQKTSVGYNPNVMSSSGYYEVG